MIKQGFEFWVSPDFPRRAYDLAVLCFTPGKREMIAAPMVFSEIAEDGRVIPPTLSMSPEDATALMSALWRAGVRPHDVGTTGELAAVKFHLEDMRKLVFDKRGE